MEKERKTLALSGFKEGEELLNHLGIGKSKEA